MNPRLKCFPPQLLADRFVEFSTFSASANLQLSSPYVLHFFAVTKDQVTKVITNSPSKSCSLDPWPTFLVLDYLDILITPITAIINDFLEQGKCPNFILQILERVVAVQLQTHLDEAGLMTAFQSAYRKYHSNESALLNIQNDILLNMAKGTVTALTLLDLSATFDTIDHTILLDRLNVYYGLSELALGWFKSYLSERTHSVKVGSTLSHPAALHYRVPKGSCPWTNPVLSLH